MPNSTTIRERPPEDQRLQPKLVKRVARRAGINICHHLASFVDIMCRHNIATVLDVGASKGQYGLENRELGFHGQILYF